jgi:predicted transcriptional regulator
MNLFDELRMAMRDYMLTNGVTKRDMAKALGCSPCKIAFMLPVLDKRGRMIRREYERPSLREPQLSRLVTILRESGHIEQRLRIPS